MRRCTTAALLIALLAAAGCDEVNPATPQMGAMKYPLPPEPAPDQPLPVLTRATNAQVRLLVDEHNESNDHIILVNASDGALYGMKLTVNNDYLYTVPLIERGQTLRIPETWLATKGNVAFPSAQRVRMERVEVRHEGKLVAFFDARGYSAPAE
ncbi:MAG: hypothetical protein BIFFINMI_01020 [Phycisphaerae bacterium]|nr:hypothetical protein [Phycisphaerae bacterium]